jgi:RNA polymerase sigma factor (sigma-70 family)
MATAELGTLMRHIKGLAAGRAARHGTDRQLLDAFAARRDEGAFTSLVGRHGPMVLRACRRVLGHEQDAEDAFQATFLVLARSAAAIRKHEALASFLHGVAYRTAMKAKRGAARRRHHEARLRERTPPATPGPTWDDVQAVLDEEIERLPESFRSAFVLCVLDGKTVPAAAAELGVKAGTLSWRLARARQHLRQRLALRGIQLAALLAALSVAERAGRAAVPAALVRVTVRFGLLVAAGEPAAGVIPSHVAALAAGVTRAMSTGKLKVATAVLLAVGLAAGAAALLERGTAADETAKPPAATGAQPAAADDPGAVAYGGRVLGADGRPVAGAHLHLTKGYEYARRPSPSPEVGTTGPDGRFRFTVPKADLDDRFTVVVATAANHGPGWVKVPADGKRDDLTLRLVADDVPIAGQVVDLEGKPVPGATVRGLQINAAPGEDLGPWIEAARGKKGLSYQLEQQYFTRFTVPLPGPVTTDAEGRFRLTGVGRDRLVRVQLDGPDIASQPLCILTRPGKAIAVTEFRGRPEYGEQAVLTTYYGASFRHVAAPDRPVVGVVRDRDTKKPLAGFSIRSLKLANHPLNYFDGQEPVRSTTDAAGRYRLTGMPKGEGNKVEIVPPGDQPYVRVQADVPNGTGLGPVTLDFELKRGVWIEGQVTDKVTGRPARGGVQYFAVSGNPNLRDYPGFRGWPPGGAAVKPDGSYRIAGLPGPGLVLVFCDTRDYLRFADRDDEFGSKGPTEMASLAFGIEGSNCGAVARVDPARGADSAKRDVTLDPGWTFPVAVQGPDGQPLTRARAFGLDEKRPERKTAELTVRVLSPRRPGAVLVQHLEKGLAGVARPPKEKGRPVTVRLEPGVTVTGRLVDADGRPRAGVELNLAFGRTEGVVWRPYAPERVRTDGEGRFRIAALLPGHEFRLSDDQGELFFRGARPGETKDLGEVRLKEAE